MAYLTPADCRTAVAAVLATVPGIGQVHQRRRIIRTEDQIRQLLTANGWINGWMISPAANNTAISERHPGFYGIGVKGGGNVLTTFQFQIEGYYGIDDAEATETTFADLAWKVADELNAYGVLNIPGADFQTQADIEQFGYVLLAGVALLHYCRINIGFHGRTRG